MEKNNTYCNLLFSHVQIKPNQKYKPCCRFELADHPELSKYRVDSFSPNEILNSELWDQFRSMSLNNEKIKGCSKCYEEDANGVSSLRDGANKIFGFTEEVKLKYIEFSFGNFCNLQCRSCNSSLSSSWYDDDLKLVDFYPDRLKPKEKVIHVTDNYKVEDYLFVERIKFTGGEPMLHPNFEKFISFLVDNNLHEKITLDIFSNCSWFPKERVIDNLKKFKKVMLNLSIDGVGKVNNYVRYGSEWSVVDETADKWIATDFVIKWVPCISVYNVHSTIEMFEWWFSKKHKTLAVQENSFDKLNITLTEVLFPKHLVPSLATNKESLIKELRKYSKSKDFSSYGTKELKLDFHFQTLIHKVCKALEKQPHEDDLLEFKNYTADLDLLRNENVKDTIPELDYDFTAHGKLNATE